MRKTEKSRNSKCRYTNMQGIQQTCTASSCVPIREIYQKIIYYVSYGGIHSKRELPGESKGKVAMKAV